MAFGDKKEAWEASVNISPAEFPGREPMLTADRDDSLMAFCKAEFRQDNDIKNTLFILKDGPVVKDGTRYKRWLYYKSWGTDGIRGQFIYDNGEGELPHVS